VIAVLTSVESNPLMTANSGGPSARSMLTSLGGHLVALVVLLLIPAQVMRSNVRAKELEVVFHRPKPAVEVPTRAPLPPGTRSVTTAAPSRDAGGKPVPSTTPDDPKLSPSEAPGAPTLPPGSVSASAPEPTPQQKVGNVGILAFRDKLASLSRDTVVPNLGADARYVAADDVGKPSARSALTTSAAGSSGGINVGSLNRSVGGGGGGAGGRGNGGDGTVGSNGRGGDGGMQGVHVGRATSAIAGVGGNDRPKARSGMGPSRTDEEIQIVFDRYKASFYRLYNRELRNRPTLQGQVIVKLTIEPDGSVSMCALQSSDMDAPELASQVVERVKAINFGAKEGVQTVTITYPIDFLPAT
jgi:outer membrane biosynthesis protein TonB